MKISCAGTYSSRSRESTAWTFPTRTIRAAIEEHNEICGIISELGELRKLPNPPITSYEGSTFLQLVSECCPQYLIKDKLLETLKEVSKRKVDPKPNYRARLVVTGSGSMTRRSRSCWRIAACMSLPTATATARCPAGSRSGIREGESALTAVARHYLSTSEVPPIHEQGKAGAAPQLSQAACKRLRRRRCSVSPDEVLRILELRGASWACTT